jgi:hypothetical protein
VFQQRHCLSDQRIERAVELVENLHDAAIALHIELLALKSSKQGRAMQGFVHCMRRPFSAARSRTPHECL